VIDFLTSREALWVGGVLLAIAVITTFILLIMPSKELPLERRRPGVPKPPGGFSRFADATTELVGRLLNGRSGRSTSLLESAGIRMPLREIAVILVSILLAVLALGIVLGNGWGGLVVAAMVPLGFGLILWIRAARRRSAFANQLDESLQMLAASLRAGYSLLQAVQALAVESAEPSSDEFRRVVNETRVGRPVNESLEEVSIRMRNEDFFWVSQAIAINREVGGNLADVLEGVATTIRQRGQLRRQVEALSAEGKLSAYILYAMPFGVAGMLIVLNPGYLTVLVTNPIGWVMLGVGAVLLIIGGFWLRASVRIKF